MLSVIFGEGAQAKKGQIGDRTNASSVIFVCLHEFISESSQVRSTTLRLDSEAVPSGCRTSLIIRPITASSDLIVSSEFLVQERPISV